MEFCEKLQELRNSRGLTQEELAENLFVSRTAVSKWESGRGYPGIDSLKEISRFFSVSIDNLLTAEKAISLAEKENRENEKRMCDLFLGIADVFYFMLIFLPLYSNPVGERIFAANLFVYLEKTSFNHMVYWALFGALVVCGAAKIVLVCLKKQKGQKCLTALSAALGIITVLLLIMTREVYAVSVAFLLFIIKGILLIKYAKADEEGR